MRGFIWRSHMQPWFSQPIARITLINISANTSSILICFHVHNQQFLILYNQVWLWQDLSLLCRPPTASAHQCLFFQICIKMSLIRGHSLPYASAKHYYQQPKKRREKKRKKEEKKKSPTPPPNRCAPSNSKQTAPPFFTYQRDQFSPIFYWFTRQSNEFIPKKIYKPNYILCLSTPFTRVKLAITHHYI